MQTGICTAAFQSIFFLKTGWIIKSWVVRIFLLWEKLRSKDVKWLTSSHAVMMESVGEVSSFCLQLSVITFLDFPLYPTLAFCCPLFRFWLEININSYKVTQANQFHSLSHTTWVGILNISPALPAPFLEPEQCQHHVALIFLSELCLWHGWGNSWPSRPYNEGKNLCSHLCPTSFHIWPSLAFGNLLGRGKEQW